MNAFSSFFDKIVCINLDRRKDRWQECEAEFDQLGFRAERVRAISHPHGATGCSLSHLRVIRYCRHLKQILVFEDDFAGKGDMSHVAGALASLPAGWEVVYLGGLVFHDEINRDKVADHLHRAKNVVCTHAMGLSQKGMDRILSEFGPAVASGSRTPIDEYLRSVVQPSRTAYVVTPMVFDQRPGYSDIAKQAGGPHNLFTITNNKFK